MQDAVDIRHKVGEQMQRTSAEQLETQKLLREALDKLPAHAHQGSHQTHEESSGVAVSSHSTCRVAEMQLSTTDSKGEPATSTSPSFAAQEDLRPKGRWCVVNSALPQRRLPLSHAPATGGWVMQTSSKVCSLDGSSVAERLSSRPWRSLAPRPSVREQAGSAHVAAPDERSRGRTPDIPEVIGTSLHSRETAQDALKPYSRVMDARPSCISPIRTGRWRSPVGADTHSQQVRSMERSGLNEQRQRSRFLL